MRRDGNRPLDGAPRNGDGAVALQSGDLPFGDEYDVARFTECRAEIASLFRPDVIYLYRRRKADTAINGHRNTSFGPGGGTRRLHPSPSFSEGSGGGEIGSTGDPKGDLSLGMIPPSSGQTYSC